jgi:hypothetical protein
VYGRLDRAAPPLPALEARDQLLVTAPAHHLVGDRLRDALDPRAV